MKIKGESKFNHDSISVLIVDDHPQMRKAIVRILESFKFAHLLESANGSEAIKILRDNVIDLVICDLYLLDVTGFDVLEFIRNREVRSDIPVIVVTGEASKEEIVKAADLGANDYLLKPFKAEDLQTKVQQLLNSYFNPPESTRLSRAAERKFLSKDYRSAVQIAEQAIQKDPLNLNARYIKALTLSKTGQTDVALKIHDEILESNSAYYRSFAASAEIHLARKDAQKAIEMMGRELELNPKQPKRQTQLAHLLLETGKVDAAINHFREALKENAKYMAALFGMGKAYALGGNLDKAIYYFKRVRRYYPTNTKSLEAIVKACLDTGDFKRAEFTLKDEKNANKLRLDTYVVLAKFYGATKEHDKAIATIDELLAIKGDDLSGLKIKAALYLKKDDIPNALKIYHSILNYANDFENNVICADIYIRISDYTNALVHLNHALRIDRKSAGILVARIAQCHYRAEEYLKAYFVIQSCHAPLSDSLKKLRDECFQIIKSRPRTTKKLIAS